MNYNNSTLTTLYVIFNGKCSIHLRSISKIISLPEESFLPQIVSYIMFYCGAAQVNEVLEKNVRKNFPTITQMETHSHLHL